MRDDGTSCWADSYGRGAGYAYWDRDKCKNDSLAYNHNDNRT